MARQARLKSKSGIYHIILRGINRQVIFEDDDDKLKFLECLSYYRNICDYTVYGYCLMDNHVHSHTIDNAKKHLTLCIIKGKMFFIATKCLKDIDDISR